MAEKENLNKVLNLLTPEEVEFVRARPAAFYAMARRSPVFFIAYVLGVNMAKCHVDMQNFISANPDSLIKAHRGLGKTTQISIGRVAWEVGSNPNIRIKIVQNTLPEARKTVTAIKEVIDSERFKKVFPEVSGNPKDWGADGFTVHRTQAGLRDPTVEAQSIFGRAGGRFDLLVADDICDLENSIRQPAKRLQVIEAFGNTWMPMGVKNARVIRTGTPYHTADIMSEWTDLASQGGLPMMELKVDDHYNSPWPEEFSQSRLRMMLESGRMNKTAYARAYQLIPLSNEDVVFQEADLVASISRLPTTSARKTTRIAALDLAFTEKTGSLSKNKDPDFSVLAIADVTDDGHVYMVNVTRARATSPKFLKMCEVDLDIYRPSVCYSEAAGPLAGVTDQWREPFRRKGCRLVTETRQNVDKYSRAIERQNIVEGGRFHLRPEDNGELARGMKVMFNELCEYPLGGHDDCVDCAVDLMAKVTNLKPFDIEETTPVPTYRELSGRDNLIGDWSVKYREGDEEFVPDYDEFKYA